MKNVYKVSLFLLTYLFSTDATSQYCNDDDTLLGLQTEDFSKPSSYNIMLDGLLHEKKFHDKAAVYAVLNCQKACIDWLIDRCIDFNMPFVMDVISDIAEHEDKKEILRLLVSRGLDVNLKNDEGLTPLMLSVKKNKAHAVKTLLKLGADPDVTTGFWPFSKKARDFATSNEVRELLLIDFAASSKVRELLLKAK